MYKFHCEYCGSLIDTETDDLCPECGAPYDNNEELKEQRERHKEQERIAAEKHDLEMEKEKERLRQQKLTTQNIQSFMHVQGKIAGGVRKITKVFKTILIVFAVIFAVSFILGIVMMVQDYIDDPDSGNSHTDPVETSAPTLVFVHDSAGFNEFADNGVLKVKVDEFEEFDPYPFDNDKGYVSVAIHFIIENASDREIHDDSKITVLMDGLLAERNNHYYDYKKLKEITLPAGVKYDGYMLYKISTSAEEIEIRYGDYITLVFDNPTKSVE